MGSSRQTKNNLVLTLDGTSLHVTDIDTFTKNRKRRVEVSPAALGRMQKTREALLNDVEHMPIYGVNTGFGPMVRHIIGKKQLKELQYNLIRGHAAGMGEPVDEAFILAAMLVRLNTLSKGHSGVSPEIAHALITFINHRIMPVVPEHGAVGTSGDLVQLAHIALGLIGEGDVIYNEKQHSAAEILKQLDISPAQLGVKEGLSLINGTSMMSGIGALLVCDAMRAIDIATRAGALAFELTRGHTDVFSADLHQVRPHIGQQEIAKSLRSLLRDSGQLVDRAEHIAQVRVKEVGYETNVLLQEVYSLRCIPQILGPVFDTVQNAKQILNTEINAVTDNPIINGRKGRYLHGGNFHGDYVATALDQMKAGMVKLTMLSERRINFFLHEHINHIFPPFLNIEQPGLTMGLQGMQFVATSTAAQSQSLAFPHSVHSIPTNGDNQDVVSMGTDAALFTHKVIENAYTLLSLELVTLSQAAEAQGADLQNLSRAGRKLLEAVRAHVPPVREDRPLQGEIEQLKKALQSSADIVPKTWSAAILGRGDVLQ